MTSAGKNKSKKVLRAAIPAHIRELFGSPPLLSTEDRDAYSLLLSELALEILPHTISEWLWVRDLADLNWEILRTRRAIASLLNISFKQALFETLIRVLPRSEQMRASDVAEQWFAGPTWKERLLVRSRIVELLEKVGLEPDSVVGQAFALRCLELEKMERMLVSAERRRDAVMRELELRRVMSQAPRNQTIDAAPAQLLPAE